MAHDFAQTLRTSYAAYYQTVLDYSPSWRRLTAPVVMAADEYTLEEQEVFGHSLWVTHSATPSSQDLDSENHTVSASPFDFFTKISMVDAERNPGLLIQIAVNAGMLAGMTLMDAFYTAVFSAASTSHPFTGTDVFNTAAINCVDDFTLIPKQGANTPGGASISQGNTYGLAFSDDSINTMINERSGYYDLSGNPVENDPGADASRPFILCPATNLQEARALAKQLGPIYDGAGLQYGQAGAVDPGIVVPPATYTTSIWALWYRRERVSVLGERRLVGPIAPITWGMPRIRITEDSDSNSVNVIGLGSWNIRYSSTIDRDLQMSTP